MTSTPALKAQLWRENVDDADLLAELEQLMAKGNEDALADAFFQDLEFGTAGLRGIVGVGTNRMNVYTVGKATQGFADYLNKHANGTTPSVAIARDSRHMGDEFTRHCASIFAANGIRVHVYPRIEPTPALSFAVRHLHCEGGICMTASHNPAAYNGYKVYDEHGCQIATEVADEISACIASIDAFADVRTCDFDQAVEDGMILWIDDAVIEAYIDAVMDCSVASQDDKDVPLKVVYTPLNGTGLECSQIMFERAGLNDVVIVESQAQPDGDFPTCPYPNPETREALEEALTCAREVKPDVVLASDPDADRVGVAVPDGDDFALLTGNEIGILLLDYLCKARRAAGTMPDKPIAVSTIVSTAMIDAIGERAGVEVRRVLTGFKYIGGIVTDLQSRGEQDRFILGFEESYGYCSGAHVRDKDAINAELLVCQMAQYYKRQGMTLYEAMRSLYDDYGYYANRTIDVSFPGADGASAMADLMKRLRTQPPTELAGRAVVGTKDYTDPSTGLPAANVIEFHLDNGAQVTIRPSGTEPKVKAYLFAVEDTQERSVESLDELEAAARDLMR